VGAALKNGKLLSVPPRGRTRELFSRAPAGRLGTAGNARDALHDAAVDTAVRNDALPHGPHVRFTLRREIPTETNTGRGLVDPAGGPPTTIAPNFLTTAAPDTVSPPASDA